jgi:hypothetical protein
VGYTSPVRTPLVILALLLPACAAFGGDKEEAERLRRQITALIGEAPCNNLVNCRILGLGARPCGGPEEYVAYSTWMRRDQIQIRAQEYNFLREELLSREAVAGTCEALPEPRAACVSGRCVVAPAER